MVKITTVGGRAIHGQLIDLDLRQGVMVAEPAAKSREPGVEDAPPLARVPIADILTLENV